jgi:hypothetical protein
MADAPRLEDSITRKHDSILQCGNFISRTRKL